MARLNAVETVDDLAVAAEIDKNLRAALARINRQSVNLRRTFIIRDETRRLAAGLICSTAYGWLHIEALWVDDTHQGQGLGRSLMKAAEVFARENGCHGAWLDTSTGAACTFYEKLGYRVFAELANGSGLEPAGHRRRFLRRMLAEPDDI